MNVYVNVTLVGDGAPHDAMQIYVSPTALDAVLFDFNPSASKNVTLIKVLHAALISLMELQRNAGTPAQARCASIAITELEGTQMRAVKSLFAK